MTYRLPRDDGDDDSPRPRGRVVPIQPPEVEPPLIAIIVNGVQFGTVYPRELKARAQMDLERVRGAYDLLAWCETHGGVDGRAVRPSGRTDLEELEDALAEMPLGAIVDLATSISAALGEAMGVPKARRRP